MEATRELIADLGDGYTEWGAEINDHLVIWVEHGERVSPFYDLETECEIEPTPRCIAHLAASRGALPRRFTH